jgi:hypothetical protein
MTEIKRIVEKYTPSHIYTFSHLKRRFILNNIL